MFGKQTTHVEAYSLKHKDPGSILEESTSGVIQNAKLGLHQGSPNLIES